MVTLVATLGGLYRDILEPLLESEAQTRAGLETRLARALREEQVLEMSGILEKIKFRVDVSDLYNYYKGVNLVLAPGSSKPPEIFWSKIPPTSDFYIRARKDEFIQCQRTGGRSCAAEAKVIAGRMENDRVQNTFYYFLKALDPMLTTEQLLALAEKFRTDIGFMYSFEDDSLKLSSEPGGSVTFEVLYLEEIPAIIFLLETRILESAESGSELVEELNSILKPPADWDSFDYRLKRGFSSLGDFELLGELEEIRQGWIRSPDRGQAESVDTEIVVNFGQISGESTPSAWEIAVSCALLPCSRASDLRP